MKKRKKSVRLTRARVKGEIVVKATGVRAKKGQPVLLVDAENPALAEVVRRLGARKPVPAGLSNSEMMRWLRENR